MKYLLLIAAITCLSCNQQNKDVSGKKILVYSKTTGWRHTSIPFGKKAIEELGKKNGFAVDVSEDSSFFSDDRLKQYDAVVFLNTTGNVLEPHQEIAFERYIQSGGGFVGIHSASDTEYDWKWYAKLVGGNFVSHPEVQDAKLTVIDKNHPSTKHLGDTWMKKDEWYNFIDLNKDVKVLLKIDEQSYKGGTNGPDHPMAWYHEYDGGRAFYTALGHTDESYSDSVFLQHILGGIQYATAHDALDYSKARSVYAPDSSHFTKTTLTMGEFFEPTEMTILPNLDVLITQRRGEILLYKNSEKKVKQAGFLNVYFKAKNNTNVEEGLLGICRDPQFEKNSWVYVFYSPADTSVNRLSRFKFINDSIHHASEQVILQFYSQREICCHTGGSIAFGPDGSLFVSTGDNSTPFDEPKQSYVNHGFAPLDDRPGHEQYDARRSSGNTNDLRGKILRIKVQDDGTFILPPGNLFEGDSTSRGEIYVMGNRNPYRISVDQKTGFLYWGEVGPDAAKDSIDTRGPRGYDEINQARKAGNFGWPLLIANNFSYKEYDYATGKTGITFDVARPLNNSRNNTGRKELPPGQPAFIWYPYDVANPFPQAGSGGRTAMAGPVYHSDLYPGKKGLPDYYNGKLFIYEFMRNWIMAVTMQPNGDFWRMEPFLPNIKWAAPMDMELGPDGKLYVLEYGTGWFSKNKDAGLSRIDYRH